VADLRLRALNDRPVRPEGDYVLYWMTAFRRLSANFALECAADRSRELGKPLVILEPLRAGYRWASHRFHRFVLEGMAETERRLAATDVLYYPYVEPTDGDGQGLLAALAARAALVVADDYPAFFYPRMLAAAADQLPVRLEAVDSNGLLPLRAAPKVALAAYHFRRVLQRELPVHLGDLPQQDPLAEDLPPRLAALPGEILARWPRASAALLAGDAGALAELPIDPSVPPVDGVPGGETAAAATLERFLDRHLAGYGEGRNDASVDATSRLSPYLHFGMISIHQVLAALAGRERWTPARLAAKASGAREGWWGMSPGAEKFLDEAVTWREVGYNMAAGAGEAYEHWESLPDWARATLDKHAGDPRPDIYSLTELEAGETHDPLWNAAQGQLREEGRIHNYLRMLWGKKVLEWSASPRQALAALVELNNKYALDGRDPNSYSGIFWCFGRYDRPWAPERPIFGVVRYMSSDSTRRKMPIDRYIRRYAPAGARQMRLV
jgi:deoxyribodipyrimidine photo-lyase